MKSFLNAGKITLDIISFFALMFILVFLLHPYSPLVHLKGFWELLLEILAMYGFYALVAWILRSAKKKSSPKAS